MSTKRYHNSQSVYTSHKKTDYYYPSNSEDNKTVRNTSLTVLFIGIVLVILIIAFIAKNSDVALLAGIVPSGFVQTDESKKENPFGVFFGAICFLGLAGLLLIF